jgi:hypothetical protein
VEAVGLTSKVVGLAAGFYHVCGALEDDEVACWGGNDTGQLGNGTTVDSPVPIAAGATGGTSGPTVVPGEASADAESAAVAEALPTAGDPSVPVGALAVAVAIGLVVIAFLGWSLRTRRRRG